MRRYIYILFALFFVVSLSGTLLSGIYLSRLRGALEVVVEAGESMRQRDLLHQRVEDLLGVSKDDDAYHEVIDDIKKRLRKCEGCHHKGAYKEKVEKIKEAFLLVGNSTPGAKKATARLYSLTRSASQKGQELIMNRTERALRVSREVFPLFFSTVLALMVLLVVFTVIIIRRAELYTRKVVKAAGLIAEGKAVGGTIFREEFKPVGDAFGLLQREITIREEKLLNWNRRWQMTFDSINETMAVCDISGMIVQANRAFKERFGYDSEGLKLCDLVCRDFASVVRCPMQRAIDTGEIQQETLAKEGCVLDIVAYPLAGQDGSLQGGIWIGRDITKEKELEARALQSEKMVALGELVSGIAHEVNNPLSVALGYSEMLLDSGEVNERDSKRLEKIFNAIKRSSNIIRNLLDFARKRPPEEIECNLSEITEGILDLMAYELNSEGITILKEFADLPPVKGDPFQLRQVALNLLKNARDALRETGNEEGIIKTRTFVEGGRVFLEVTDNGPMIPEDIMGRIFEPFFTTKDIGKGTGLGLSITYSIVKWHGGDLFVENLPEGGVRFTAAFPSMMGDGALPA
ncbi:globin-coupled histidine kinase [bacterium BMS3Bbin06]|nr:globin-coupled histidine kinase [bacterium BMS3Abin08]GBE35154.1 globin-coupled histidine kinase [bacterium BMS3Bbin06]HDO36449.1 PAS domain S-box protein [Nitrospirota bacterium]HDY70136.1 PAS domain S-box protein [Nitrospirota bacterium]